MICWLLKILGMRAVKGVVGGHVAATTGRPPMLPGARGLLAAVGASPLTADRTLRSGRISRAGSIRPESRAARLGAEDGQRPMLPTRPRDGADRPTARRRWGEAGNQRRGSG